MEVPADNYLQRLKRAAGPSKGFDWISNQAWIYSTGRHEKCQALLIRCVQSRFIEMEGVDEERCS